MLLLAVFASACALRLLQYWLDALYVLFAVAVAEENVDALLVFQVCCMGVYCCHWNAGLAYEAVYTLLHFGTWYQHVLVVLSARLQGSSVLTKDSLAALALLSCALGRVEQGIIVLLVPRHLGLALPHLRAVSLDCDVVARQVALGFVLRRDGSRYRVVLISSKLLILEQTVDVASV